MPALIPIEQLERLRRETWQGEDGATRLSQELYALLDADLPIESTTPVTLTQADPTQPVLTVIPSTDPDAVPATNVSGSGGGSSSTDPSSFSPTAQPGSTGLNPLILYGVVQGKISGNVYSVTCWMKSPTGPPLGNYPVTQGQMDPTETISSGTVVPCVMAFLKKSGSQTVIDSMWMQVPVFTS